MPVDASSWSATRDETAIAPVVLKKVFQRSRGLPTDNTSEIAEGSSARGRKRKANGELVGSSLGEDALRESIDLAPEAENHSIEEDRFQVHHAKIRLSINPRAALLDRGGVLRGSPDYSNLSKLLETLEEHAEEGVSHELLGRFTIGMHNWVMVHATGDTSKTRTERRERLFQLPPAQVGVAERQSMLAAGFDGSSERTADWFTALCTVLSNSSAGSNPFVAEVQAAVSWQHLPRWDLPSDGSSPLQRLASLVAFNRALHLDIELNVFSSIYRLCSPVDPRLAESFRLVMHTLFPRQQNGVTQPITADQTDVTNLGTFYSNLLPAPMIPAQVMAKMQPGRLGATLLPFQKRSIAFLLKREGAVELDPSLRADSHDPYGFWEELTIDESDKTVYFCRITGMVRPSSYGDQSHKHRGKLLSNSWEGGPTPEQQGAALHLSRVRGSILADEMGLGKTLEVIALILLHPGPTFKREHRSSLGLTQDGSHSYVDFWTGKHVQRVKATLIVVPQSLVQQWLDEFAKHAPDVVVIRYEGWKKLEANHDGSSKNKYGASMAKQSATVKVEEDIGFDVPSREFISNIVESEVDVVLTDFATLRTDFDVRHPPPKRPRRGGVEYVRSDQPRSPIVAMHWWRLVIDETQLADPSGATKPAETLRVIARTHSLAVSGTPAKAITSDLYGSLHFIGVPLSMRQWQSLQRMYFLPAFIGLFEKLCIRTTKKQLKDTDGLQETPAKYVVPVQLTPIEMQYYLEVMQDSLESLQITPDGFPATINWMLDHKKLRSAVHLLRQTCTLSVHIAAQGRNRRGAMDAHAHRQLMTMKDALTSLQWEAQQARWQSLKDLARLQIDKAQIYGQLIRLARQNEELEPNSHWLSFEQRPDEKILDHLRKELASYVQTLQEAADRLNPSSENTDDGASEASAEDVQERAVSFQVNYYRSRAKEFLMLQHQCAFLLGDVYHVMGNKEKEDEAYGEATRIRQEAILKVAASKANRAFSAVAGAIKAGGIKHFAQLELAEIDRLGIYGQSIQEEADELIELMNENAEMAWNWRGEIVRIFGEPVSSEEEATGEEYQDTLKAQAILEVYLANYAAILADRKAIMNEQRTLLAAHEGRFDKKRRTKAALDAEEGESEQGPSFKDIVEEDDVEKLQQELSNARRNLQSVHSRIGKPLKAILIELNGKISRAVGAEEIALARRAIHQIREAMKTQSFVVEKLENELDQFRKAFNSRVLYFKDLQALSDSVVERDFGPVPLEVQLGSLKGSISVLEKTIALGQARLRYLRSLDEEHAEMQKDKCVLCLSSFNEVQTVVLLRGCGHAVCSDCFFRYRGTAAGHRCLLCRHPITAGDVQKVLLKPDENRLDGAVDKTKSVANTDTPMPQLSEEFFSITPHLDEIQQTEITGLWSSKIALLIKNILCRQSHSPSTKHLVFSAWRDALVIVKAALDQNAIAWVDLDDRKKNADPVRAFTDDPSITVFLMHGERSASGLTLTAASVVHLLEPLINSSFEAQAIGRVDRIGQRQKTEVYCYATKDTVETRILHTALRHGNCIYSKDKEAAEMVPTTVAKRGGDDLSGSDYDLLELIL